MPLFNARRLRVASKGTESKWCGMKAQDEMIPSLKAHLVVS